MIIFLNNLSSDKIKDYFRYSGGFNVFAKNHPEEAANLIQKFSKLLDNQRIAWSWEHIVEFGSGILKITAQANVNRYQRAANEEKNRSRNRW